jgi:hypothetical protein
MKERNYIVKEIEETLMHKSKHYFQMELDVFDDYGEVEKITVEFNTYEFLRELDVNDIIEKLKQNLKEGIDQL